MNYIYKFSIIIILSVFAVLLYFSQKDGTLYFVNSDSMSPRLNKGDLVVLKSAETLSVGDIITFKSPTNHNTQITHRIVERSFELEWLYKTKGDNNKAPDPWRITSDMVVGKLSYKIPFVGHAGLFLNSSPVYLYVLGVVFLIFSYLEINQLTREIADYWSSINKGKLNVRITSLRNKIGRIN